MNMITIKHPTLLDVQREVPEKEADGWLEAGWVRVEDETAQQSSPTKRK